VLVITSVNSFFLSNIPWYANFSEYLVSAKTKSSFMCYCAPAAVRTCCCVVSLTQAVLLTKEHNSFVITELFIVRGWFFLLVRKDWWTCSNFIYACLMTVGLRIFLK